MADIISGSRQLTLQKLLQYRECRNSLKRLCFFIVRTFTEHPIPAGNVRSYVIIWGSILFHIAYLVSWHIAIELTPIESSPIWQFSLLAELNWASLILFFCFILRFWNHILTCVSFNPSDAAISILLALVRYLLKWNSFSNSVSCLFVKFVRPMFEPAPPAVCAVWAVG